MGGWEEQKGGMFDGAQAALIECPRKDCRFRRERCHPMGRVNCYQNGDTFWTASKEQASRLACSFVALVAIADIGGNWVITYLCRVARGKKGLYN